MEINLPWLAYLGGSTPSWVVPCVSGRPHQVKALAWDSNTRLIDNWPCPWPNEPCEVYQEQPPGYDYPLSESTYKSKNNGQIQKYFWTNTIMNKNDELTLQFPGICPLAWPYWRMEWRGWVWLTNTFWQLASWPGLKIKYLIKKWSLFEKWKCNVMYWSLFEKWKCNVVM